MEFLLSLFRWWRPSPAVPMLPCKPCQRPPRTLTHDTLLRMAKGNPPPAEWYKGDEACPFIAPITTTGPESYRLPDDPPAVPAHAPTEAAAHDAPAARGRSTQLMNDEGQ